MFPSFQTIWLSLGGTILLIMYYGVIHVMSKLKEIVPEAEIRNMIDERIAPETVKWTMLYDLALRTERKVDALLEGMRDDRRHSSD